MGIIVLIFNHLDQLYILSRNILTVTQIYCFLTSSEIQFNFILANTRNISKSNNTFAR